MDGEITKRNGFGSNQRRNNFNGMVRATNNGEISLTLLRQQRATTEQHNRLRSNYE